MEESDVGFVFAYKVCWYYETPKEFMLSICEFMHECLVVRSPSLYCQINHLEKLNSGTVFHLAALSLSPAQMSMSMLLLPDKVIRLDEWTEYKHLYFISFEVLSVGSKLYVVTKSFKELLQKVNNDLPFTFPASKGAGKSVAFCALSALCKANDHPCILLLTEIGCLSCFTQIYMPSLQKPR